MANLVEDSLLHDTSSYLYWEKTQVCERKLSDGEEGGALVLYGGLMSCIKCIDLTNKKQLRLVLGRACACANR
jgi:hypothetical protein